MVFKNADWHLLKYTRLDFCRWWWDDLWKWWKVENGLIWSFFKFVDFVNFAQAIICWCESLFVINSKKSLISCRQSWSKRLFAGSQQRQPDGQIGKWFRGDGRSHGRTRCGTWRRCSGRSDSWLLLWGGGGRGRRRQWGHWGQRWQSCPQEGPIQLRQGPGHCLLTPQLCPLIDWHTHRDREVGGDKLEDRNTVIH